MGCITSKHLFTTDLDEGLLFYDNHHKSNADDIPHHLVSLTSSTYGALNLDRHGGKTKQEAELEEVSKEITELKKRSSSAPTIPIFMKRVTDEEPTEIINTWELMKDLAGGEETPIWSPLKKKTPKSRTSAAVSDIAMATPMKQKTKLAGKENKITPLCQVHRRSDTDPGRVLRPFSPLENIISARNSEASRSKRSLAPVFDPELVASFEQEICEQEEQIKKMVAPTTRNRKARDSTMLLQSFEEKCPPGGENVVVLYTTTLRGIRKTFEDCNAVRALIESCDVQIVERDISMDSGFREELRVLMGRKEVRVPLLFVKGRLIGGAEEVLKLDEEGKLGLLMEGIPAAGVWCDGCAGVRFVMCTDCSGSCKVLDEEQKKTVRCGECNENGLIHCPICS